MAGMIAIQPATPDQADTAAELIHLSMSALADYLFGAGRPEQARRVLTRLFRQPRNRFSYTFTRLGWAEGRPVGAVLAYAGRDMPGLDRAMSGQMLALYGPLGFARFVRRAWPLIFQREAEADEYFINSLAVFPPAQGRGIGARLLRQAEDQARAAGWRKCALSVDVANVRARQLYERSGYQLAGVAQFEALRRRLGYAGFQRLVKNLD